MRWKGGPRSSNVSDRRAGGPMAVGVGLGGVVLVVLHLVLGGAPEQLQQSSATAGGAPSADGAVLPSLRRDHTFST